jgi:RNA polymerase sigma factor (sigma-70 family)
LLPVGLCFSVDADGFEEWYREQYRRVFASVLIVSGNRAATADAVDEAFARALERWPRVRTMASPVGWTFTVARNLLRRAARRSARERTIDIGAGSAPEIDVALWEVVRSLPKRERELVALRYVAGLTEPEIAATLGIAKGTVSRGLHDARAHLHSMLAPEEDPA